MWNLGWRLGTGFLDVALQHMASLSSHQPERHQQSHCSFYAWCLCPMQYMAHATRSSPDPPGLPPALTTGRLSFRRHAATKGILVAMVCTFFEAFNVPVFWPILVMYFIMLFCITMKRQIKVTLRCCCAARQHVWCEEL